MTVFRPTATVRSPDGREWEIYAYKIAVGEAEDWDVGDPFDCGRLALLSLFVWLVTLIPRLLLRLADVAAAGARSLRSSEWTIEAVSWLPAETRYTWTTTSEFRGQVLAQVEGHLARGDVPLHLTNALYRGERRR